MGRKIIFIVSFFLLSSCAFTTEPQVRAYLHETSAYQEIKAGDFAHAEHELKEALADDPKNPAILNNMAYLCFRERKLSLAIGYLEQARAVRSNDDDDPYILNEARIWLLERHVQKAKQLLDLVKKRKRWPKGYKDLYAKVLWKEGSPEESLKFLLDKKEVWRGE